MPADEPPRPLRRFGWSDMFAAPDDDPREDGGWANDERSVLLGSLDDRRLTLEMKCAGLDAEASTRCSIPPSDMSLIGLVRHLTMVERYWFRRTIAGDEVPLPYEDDEGRDTCFVVTPDPVLVEEAWAAWHDEVAHSRRVISSVDDLGQLAATRDMPVREILVHLVHEYARHLGHADLLRERIDGRVGQ